MCGIVGISAESNVAAEIYDSLLMLQHRGQDAAGMVVCDSEGKLNSRKSMGYVRDVFQQNHMNKLVGNYGIGHVRYPTAGGAGKEFAQPMYVNSPYGISLAHNGNLTNSKELAKQLFHAEMRHLNTDSDSEVLLNIFAHELGKQREIYPSAEHIFKAVTKTHRRCDGAYAVLALITGHGILGFRDNNAIRPLSIGIRKGQTRDEYIIASEDALFTSQGFEKLRDVEPGEAVFIDKNGNFFSQQCAEAPEKKPCIFEYVYFSRPDSKIDEISVYKARMRMGSKLAQSIKKINSDHDIDVVIPIPDSSTTAALQLAVDLDVPYREGFVKNRYIGRTFIMPYQEERKKSVRRKLNILDLEFRGKNVLLVDDSIVRGTTSKKIIEMAKESGAKKVYFASAAPAIKYQNLYGIDMPATKELVASNRTHEEVAKEIGADWLIYQTLEDLIDTVQYGNPDIKEFETSIFTGDYITPLGENYLQDLEDSRQDDVKAQRENA
ncbi:amidophosphoribosyltransferase [Gammaproteobacteria bacterium]|nr:amidophosphoribosyltransferase [Gammaproteobacteria bacterium]MDC0511172.1 amidophosphoribosyltransferase [bacterium]MDA7709988.1 amidophosphoribosyltransferase [Gammaproteobacteria bacterium]MDA7800898.1 amidophosphoribosyltransferase [Gammaproteobacteria bacterium]MDA7821740.1 amidophosphoribosyltransferase [Gammaproteobacteria bacterium]|tara:strand:+ start:4428 stop:5906 length:1479 start_codon:yes stop_codon:yes gene_type:complete